MKKLFIASLIGLMFSMTSYGQFGECNIPYTLKGYTGQQVLVSFTPPANAIQWQPQVSFESGGTTYSLLSGASAINPYVLSRYNGIFPGQTFNIRTIFTMMDGTACYQEDTISIPISCAAATGLTYAVTGNDVTLSWQGSGQSYDIYLNNIYKGSVTNNSATMTLANGLYEWFLVKNCSNGNKAGSPKITFQVGSSTIVTGTSVSSATNIKPGKGKAGR